MDIIKDFSPNMEIIKGFPPNYDLLKIALNIPKHAIFCYGNKIYNPTGKKIDEDIIYHETIHRKQQGIYPEQWYNRYISYEEFRQDQEIEAYGEQYKWNKERISGKLLRWRLEKMAEALSNDYNLKLSFNEAISKIRNYEKSRRNK